MTMILSRSKYTTGRGAFLWRISLVAVCVQFTGVRGFTSTTIHPNSKSLPLSISTRRFAAKKQTVAVIGGGIAGLSCATALQKSGKFIPTVFDTGRLRPGGRCSSRLPGDPMKKDHTSTQAYPLLSSHIIDHAAQIITVPKELTHFAKQVQDWEAQGIIQQFTPGTVCDVICSKGTPCRIVPLNSPNQNVNMYYGVNGMGSIPWTMSKTGTFDVKQDVWVSPSNGVKYVQSGDDAAHWIVKGNGKLLGQFDNIVIAHNGKCADRLMSQTPATELHKLLQVNFSPEVPSWGGSKMTLNSIYSLTFAIHKNRSPLAQMLPEDTFTSGFIKNQPSLKFISCNTRKHASGTNDDIEIWTLLSSAKFAKKYKGPQEDLPDDVVNKVTGLLLSSLEQALNLKEGILQGPIDGPAGCGMILESRLQLWGAGVPLNTWKATSEPHGFLYDAKFRVGTCGDWLLDPSIAGAWESGRRLAEYMSTSKHMNVGLEGKFEVSKGVDTAGIGSLT